MRFKFGPALHQLYQAASVGGYALPALNVTNSSQIVAALEAAQRVNSPVVIQFAHAGAQALAGKKIDNQAHQASVAGAIGG
nr:class II fructose-bisphosphate aldolase [Bernardetiaceae bacterium]